jgi:hypothetical protein
MASFDPDRYGVASFLDTSTEIGVVNQEVTSHVVSLSAKYL